MKIAVTPVLQQLFLRLKIREKCARGDAGLEQRGAGRSRQSEPEFHGAFAREALRLWLVSPEPFSLALHL
jgi:hypothetical protein